MEHYDIGHVVVFNLSYLLYKDLEKIDKRILFFLFGQKYKKESIVEAVVVVVVVNPHLIASKHIGKFI